MHRVFLCLVLVACGGKIDPGGDGGSGLDSGNGGKDGQPTADVISPPPPPPSQCTPITGTISSSTDGSCTSTATWSCGATSYTVECSCPSSQCTCSQESGGMGA